MLLQGICAFFATAAFSVLFYLPRKYILQAGMTGSLGWFAYLAGMRLFDNKALATLAATMAVAMVAHILARIYKTPVTMFLIPGIIPLVPGAGMYEIVQSILGSDRDRTAHYFFETFQLAGAIALGIFIIDTFFRRNGRKKTQATGG